MDFRLERAKPHTRSAAPAVVVEAWSSTVRPVVVKAGSSTVRPVVESWPTVVVAASEVAAVVEPVAVAVEVIVTLVVIPVRAPTRVIRFAWAPVVVREGRWLSVCDGRDTQAGQT
jgi:hypothetical protein